MDLIAKFNVYQLTYNMSISQGVYTQYCPDHLTKCSSICFALKLTKLNVRQMYRIYGIANTSCDHRGSS